ncbi:hypothetical protein G6F32_017551 [Rhizopus arrhizus]|nr:hypothetical protein G6F32_017551 [Rhizopus arrhizus]
MTRERSSKPAWSVGDILNTPCEAARSFTPSSASRMATRNSGVPGLAPDFNATGNAATTSWPASHIWPPNVLVEPAPLAFS